MLQTLLEAFRNFDSQALLYIQDNIRMGFLTPVMIFLSRIGDNGYVWIAITLLLLIFKKTRKAGLVSALALLGSLCVTNFWLKPEIARIRPYEVINDLTILVPKETDFSFPSGHTSAAFASAIAIACCSKKRLAIPCVILASLIAFSRLYVGVHYPTDVICGAIIGTLLACIMFWLFGAKEYKRRERKAAGRK